MWIFKIIGLLITVSLSLSLRVAVAQIQIVVKADEPYAKIEPVMWGLFFEDINFAADGGLYAELVKNRSFEFPGFQCLMMGWHEVSKKDKTGHVHIMNRGDGIANARYVSIKTDRGEGSFGLRNEGFRGMGIRKNEQYRFSVDARIHEGSNIRLRVQLVDPEGQNLGETTIGGFTNEWRNYESIIQAGYTETEAELNVLLEGEGTLDMDMISLFPVNTWNNRRNGLRADLVKMLADLNPGFFRFPGGCIVEGPKLSLRYQWKKTVGPVEDRKLIINRWNKEFMSRHTPDYFQSFGLGFYEYFLLAKDLGAEPLPIINCGMACQYNTGELVPLSELDLYIQDALDLIEFANGPADTEWGGLRKKMGHPEPFNLKYIGIGNEQYGPQYIERYELFADALRESYPEIKLVSGSGPWPDGKEFEYLWSQLKDMETDLVDEHYYRDADWFFKNAGRYNDYDREAPKVFAGEYAAHDSQQLDDPSSRNTWRSALAEAAFMTGLERNADVVHMASYAPLFAHVNAWQWRPNLIWFDNLNVVGTPNYYVQKLYATNPGTHVVPILSDGEVLEGREGIYGSATADKINKELIMKMVNNNKEVVSVNINFEGLHPKGNNARIITMASVDGDVYNTIEEPDNIIPVEKEIIFEMKDFEISLEPKSFSVIKIGF